MKGKLIGFVRQWGPMLLSIVVIAGIIVYLRRSGALGEINLSTIRWGYMVVLLPLQAAYIGVNGLILKLFLRHDGLKLTFIEWYGLPIISTVSNLLMPGSGGVVARAGYLKLNHDYPLTQFSALLGAGYLLQFMVSGMVGVVMLLGAVVLGGRDVPLIALGLMAGMAIGPLIVQALPLERLPIPEDNRVLRLVSLVLDGWRQIRQSTTLLVKQTLLAALSQFVLASSLYMGLLGMALDASFIDAVMIGVLINIATVIRVTPGGLGSIEVAAGLGAELIGSTAVAGFSAAILVRLASWVVAFSLTPIFVYLLSQGQDKPAFFKRSSES